MSSFKILLGSGLSAVLKQRLVSSNIYSKNLRASYALSRRCNSNTRIQHGVVYTTGLTTRNSIQQTAASFHSSASRNRNETNIDESLHRLDSEIRRVGRIRRQEVDEILEDIKEMKKATSSQSLMIIRCCGELIPEEPPSRRTELVQSVWKTLETLKVPMDVSHYNALLRVYLENEYKFNPTEFLQDLTSKGIEPNRVTYQRLIARFCQDGDIDGASTILQHMKDKQMPINEYVFNSLILGHAQTNDMESAEGILNVMRQAGLEPNDDTYVTLMTGYAKHGNMENVHRIVKECEEKEVFLIDRDFLNVIYALAENNHQQLIDEILPYLKKHAGFNQEVTSLVFRLVNINQEDTAFKMLKEMVPIIRQEGAVPAGSFFVKHLVQLSKPSETIIKYCKKLYDEGLNKYGLTRACEFAIITLKFDLALELIEALYETKFPIRQHYFWPILAGAKSEEDVYNCLKFMKNLRIEPTSETLREYVVPALLSKRSTSVERTLEKLSGTTGIPLDVITSSAMINVLYQGGMKLASEFATKYRLRFYGNHQLRRAIIDSYIRSNDAPAFVKIIGGACLNDGVDAARENVGMMLMELVDSIRSNQRKAQLVEPVLKELLANGLGLSNSGSELLQNQLGESLTPEIANIIIQLTSSELTPKISIVQDSGRRSASTAGQLDERTTAELEEMLADAIKNNGPVKAIKKSLLYKYCRSKDIEKLDKLKEDLEKEGFVFTLGLQAMFMEAYTLADRLEPAKAAYEEVHKSLETVDDVKILRYAALLLSKGDMDGCIDVIKKTKRDEVRKPSGAAQQATAWKILNTIAEEGNPEKVKEMFELLKERNLTPITAVTLGPLIKAYLVKDDLAGALEEYERCTLENKVTPWKQELFCRFIKMEDADRLQKVMDLSTNIHGEVNSMYDLVFAFIDCGKVRQARKILETPGLRARNDKIEMYCQRYFQDGRVSELENLIQITKDLVDVDRNTMYFYLLQAYCKQGDADKALSIWTSMQEENVQPSAELLIYLADFLRKSNYPVPFVIPDPSEISSTGYSEPEVSGLPRSIKEIRRAIDVNDVDKALQIKQRLESEGSTLNIADMSQLIEKLARAERLNEALKLAEQMLDKGTHPFPKTFRFLIGRLASAADVQALEMLGDKLNSDLRRTVMFNSRLCQAYTNAGKGKEFYEMYVKPVVQSATITDESPATASGENQAVEDVDEIGNVPVGGSISLLMKHEELLPEFKQLVNQAHPVHRRVINNIIWGVNLMKRNFNEAKEIWENQLKSEPRILFRNITFEARDTNDVELACTLATQVLSADQIQGRSKAVACSCAIDLLGGNNKVDEALQLLTDSLKVIKLDDYPVPILRRLKERAEAENKKFPYVIPTVRSDDGQRVSLNNL